jgi:hypothetical protein
MRRTWTVFSCLVAGCAVSQRAPVDAAFERAWLEDAVNREVQTKDEYLEWVAAFYDGTGFVSGWTRRQADLCAGLEPLEAAVAVPRLEAFGRLVAAEWAKDNSRRRIDSDLLLRLGGILSHAKESGRLVPVLEALSTDVHSVIAGEQEPEAITPGRYEKFIPARDL